MNERPLQPEENERFDASKLENQDQDTAVEGWSLAGSLNPESKFSSPEANRADLHEIIKAVNRQYPEGFDDSDNEDGIPTREPVPKGPTKDLSGAKVDPLAQICEHPELLGESRVANLAVSVLNLNRP